MAKKLKIKLNASASALLVESLLDKLEKKDSQIKELEDAKAKHEEHLESRSSVDFATIEVLTDFLGNKHPELMPELVEHAKQAVSRTDYQSMPEGAFQAVAWYFEAEDTDENIAAFQSFVKLVKETKSKEQ